MVRKRHPYTCVCCKEGRPTCSILQRQTDTAELWHNAENKKKKKNCNNFAIENRKNTFGMVQRKTDRAINLAWCSITFDFGKEPLSLYTDIIKAQVSSQRSHTENLMTVQELCMRIQRYVYQIHTCYKYSLVGRFQNSKSQPWKWHIQPGLIHFQLPRDF